MAEEISYADTNLSLRRRLSEFSWRLGFVMFYMSSCAFNFGYDVGNFGGVQGMQSFGKRFGEYHAKTHSYALPAWLSSLMTSLPFLGKALGAICCGWAAEKYGRRMAILILVVLSFVGVLLETTSTTSAQFTIGRFIAFGMTGMTIVVVPIYQGEVSPKPLRGMMAGTLQLAISFGGLVASLVNYRTQKIASDKGWRISVGLQFIAPALILALLPFLPESPRWLISKDRHEDAKRSLKKLRKKNTSNEEISLEIEALSHMNSSHGKGSWADVFNPENRVRTFVAVLVMFGQQITGQAFSSQYGIIFYLQNGFKSQAFLFGIIASVVGIVCLILTWIFVDGFGRRPLLLIGGFLMGAFLFIIAGISSISHPNTSEKHAMVASFMLYGASYSMSWAPISYIVLSEAAGSRVREKTNLFASVISILTTFVTSFTLPYLMNAPYAALGGKIGYIYGSFCMVMVVAAYFGVPELKGRSLEEVDQLFASGAPLRSFGNIQTETAEKLYVEKAGSSLKITDKSEGV